MLSEHETHILTEAERYVNELHDENLAFFILRDLPLTERLGWKELCWALFNNYSGTANEARWMIRMLRNERASPNVPAVDIDGGEHPVAMRPRIVWPYTRE